MNEYDEDDDKINENVDSIINQLKNQSRSLKKVTKNPPKQLNDTELKQYIIDKTSEIVEGCVDVIGVIQDEIKCAPDPKLIESGATFINAFTSALDALTKLEVTQQKIQAQKDIVEFNAANKLTLGNNDNNGPNKQGLYFSREELIKSVLEYKKDEVKEVSDPPIDV